MPHWPVVAFDDDGYPYLLRDQTALTGWAESPETALPEFGGAVDSTGQPLDLVFDADTPRLIPSDGEGPPLHDLVLRAKQEFPGLAPLAGPAARIPHLTPAELIAALHASAPLIRTSRW
ncbi:MULTISPECIES: hypothetical protein [Actinosynnema]|uniref:hypothetical protein n=1 Tax=Actinosynnema TaxID=40566 RepID=UPI0020A470F9|nr:hypothetical protein [Actinosynnema pretiosum]MCP2092378.1 hypothetical protein [Actinosynnema pretiosum]